MNFFLVLFFDVRCTFSLAPIQRKSCQKERSPLLMHLLKTTATSVCAGLSGRHFNLAMVLHISLNERGCQNGQPRSFSAYACENKNCSRLFYGNDLRGCSIVGDQTDHKKSTGPVACIDADSFLFRQFRYGQLIYISS